VSLAFSASFTVAQARLLPGRDPVAVTAVQLLAAVLATLPVAAVIEGVPPAPAGAHALLATAALALLGTLTPFTLFAYGQARVSPEIAGAFVNLEPLVGAAAGAVVFGDPVGMAQAAGGAAVLTGIALSSLPLLLAWPPVRPEAVEVAATEEAFDVLDGAFTFTGGGDLGALRLGPRGGMSPGCGGCRLGPAGARATEAAAGWPAGAATATPGWAGRSG
jgi:EamA-like transporter family